MNGKVYVRIHCILAAIWRRRYAIVFPILITPFIAMGVGSVSPKSYIAKVSILVQEPAMLNPFLKDFAISTQLKKRIKSLDTLLHSRHVLTEVARSLELIDDETPQKKVDVITNELSEHLSLSLKGEHLMTITYKSNKPNDMVKVLNSTAKAFIKHVLAPQLSSIRSSEDFLFKQLKIQRDALDKAEDDLAAYKTEYADQLPSLHVSTVKRLDRLRELLAERSTELAGARASFTTLKTRLAQTNPVIGKIEENIVTLVGEIALLRARYTDQHSAVQAKLRELERLRYERERLLKIAKKIKAEDIETLWQIASTSKTNVDATYQPLLLSQLQELQKALTNASSLEQETKSLQGQIIKLEKKVKSYGHNERKLNQLQRNLKVQREIYETLLERYKMANVTGSLGRFERSERVKIIDPPVAPTKPVNPPFVVFIIAGIVCGVFFSVSIALILEVSDTSVYLSSALEEITGVQVLGRVPPTEAQQYKEI